MPPVRYIAVFDEESRLHADYRQQLASCKDLHIVVVANRGKGGAKVRQAEASCASHQYLCF